jgi:PAS domain S-box-containing protein
LRGQRERHSKEAARLALATSAGGIGIWEWHLSDNSFHYSEIAKAICGFAADKPVTWEDVTGSVHPEDYPRTSAMAKRALDPNVRERVPYEYRLIRPNGEIVWVLAHGEAVFEKSDGNEVATLYIGTIQDITNRKRLEAENTASRARLALAIQAGRMAVWDMTSLRTKCRDRPNSIAYSASQTTRPLPHRK